VYAQELRSIVAELGVSDARLEEGSIRFDANVSIRPQGEETFGTKVEIKNMNSFRSLERAIAFEIDRQIELVESGGEVIQETRHWDEESGVTHSMRVKEGSSDYRYFTEPDLAPMVMTPEWVAGIRERLPELPADRRARYAAQGLAAETAGVLSALDAGLRRLYDHAVLSGAPPRSAANWITGEVLAWLRKAGVDAREARLDGPGLAELIEMVDDGSVSSSAAKDVLAGVLSGEGRPREVAERRDLLQVRDAGVLDTAVADVLAANPGAVEGFRGGEEKVVGFLVGQVMKATDGRADPRMVNQLLRERMSG
jgi:aspartyl-tRNA(Asn)/glutamyl-tRNA(Gln) amidotransferase subunit B